MEIDDILITKALKCLNVKGCDIAVHSSYRSLGIKKYSPMLVVDALLNSCKTVIVPTFCEIGRTNPPLNDRPMQNGWDYEQYTIETTNGLFNVNDFGTDSEINIHEMGIIPYSLMKKQGAISP